VHNNFVKTKFDIFLGTKNLYKQKKIYSRETKYVIINLTHRINFGNKHTQNSFMRRCKNIFYWLFFFSFDK
jgi:hypothetical protein